MNEVQRHNGILSLLEENQTINVSHIIESFNVSPATLAVISLSWMS